MWGSREDDTGHRTVRKPVIAEQYNHFMGGVDTLDQLLGTYQYPHKSQKWYHTIYHRVREVALVNGFIVYRKASELNKLDPKQFHQAVIDGLLKNWQPPRKEVGRPSLLPELCLTERHFPDKYENPKFKPECRACSDRQAGRQVQTRFFCNVLYHFALFPVLNVTTHSKTISPKNLYMLCITVVK